MSPSLEILHAEYVALRSEILLSISMQHQILLMGYGINGIVLLIYAFAPEPLKYSILSIIPIGLLIMGSLWAVECNRMVRASYYIGYVLWPEMRHLAEYKGNVGWEDWIRPIGPEKDKNIDGFRARQHHFQLVVTLIFPVVISIVTMIVVIQQQQMERSFLYTILVGVLIGWVYLGSEMLKISNLSGVTPDKNMKP